MAGLIHSGTIKRRRVEGNKIRISEWMAEQEQGVILKGQKMLRATK